jgi:hypothetical protein
VGADLHEYVAFVVSLAIGIKALNLLNFRLLDSLIYPFVTNVSMMDVTCSSEILSSSILLSNLLSSGLLYVTVYNSVS